MPTKHHPRASACANRSRAFALERQRKLSIEDRIKAALGMGKRFAWLQPVPRKDRPHD